MFASRSINEHLLRGLLGSTALVGAFLVVAHGSAWSILLAVVGVAFLRGCPTCWMIGLVETVTARSIRRVCEDGSCKIDDPARVNLDDHGLRSR